MHLVEVRPDVASLALHAGDYGKPLLPYQKSRRRIPVAAIVSLLDLPKPTELTFIESTGWARAWGAFVAGADSCNRIADLLEIAKETEESLKTWKKAKGLVYTEDCDDQTFAASWLTVIAGAKDNFELEDWKEKFTPQLKTIARRVRQYGQVEWPLIRVLRGHPLAMAPIGDVCFITGDTFGYGNDLEMLAKKWDEAGAVVAVYGAQKIEALGWHCEEIVKKSYLVFNRKFSLS